jgi:hypothetical protein
VYSFHIFLHFFVRGAFGFGSNIPIVLLTTPCLCPHHAIVLVAVADFISQIDLFPQGVRSGLEGLEAAYSWNARWHGAGTWLLTQSTPEALSVTMGLLIMAIVGMDRSRLLEWLSTWTDLRSRRITLPFAVTAGAVGTLSGGGALYF